MLTEFLDTRFPNDYGKNEKAVVILSGGLDSTILLAIASQYYDVTALTFNYNQKQAAEIDFARWHTEKRGIEHKVLNISFLGDIARGVSTNIAGSEIAMPTIRDVLGNPQPPTYVPFRNMILNSIGFSFAESVGAKYIMTGLQTTDQYGYWDTSARFVDKMNSVAEENRLHKIKMLAPFSGLDKATEILLSVQLPLEARVNFAKTLTCYNPNEKAEACGECPSCAERIAAFGKVGLEDPAAYSKVIPWDKIIQHYNTTKV